MTTRFSGKTALVTGAGSGIGRTTALAFAAEGAQVVVAGRTAASLDETVALIEARGAKALAVTADVSRSAEVHALVEAAVDRFGSLDVAVNNAAVFHGGTPLADLPEADWHAELDINVTGVFLALQAEIRQMRTQPSGGAIVNLASTVGLHTRRRQPRRLRHHDVTAAGRVGGRAGGAGTPRTATGPCVADRGGGGGRPLPGVGRRGVGRGHGPGGGQRRRPLTRTGKSGHFRAS